jgi:hypothetical protein
MNYDSYIPLLKELVLLGIVSAINISPLLRGGANTIAKDQALPT